MMKVRMIEQRDNGVCLFELKNDEIKVILDVMYYLYLQKTEKETLGMLFLDLRMWKIVGMEMEVTWERSPDVLQIVSEMQSLN